MLHALPGPASLAINDLEVGSDCLHGPRCLSKSCGETPNMFLRKISMTKHETIRFISRNDRLMGRVTGTHHLNQLLRMQVIDLEKV